MMCHHNEQTPLSCPPARVWPCPRFAPRAMRLADPKQLNGHHKWFLYGLGVAISITGEHTAMWKPWEGRG
eukprot:7169202-Prymnesium_polylepis.1